MSTDEQKTKEFLEKGVLNIYPSKEFLEEKIKEGKTLTMYLGMDPTGPTLHLGHTIPLIKLRQFQELGHKVILLIGDFTAMIGDPSGKDQTRKPLSKEEVSENLKLYKEQASKIINFEGENPAEIKFNSEWLSKMSFEEVLKNLSNITVDQMLKRDMFQRRQESGRPIYLHEFMYPFMQGMDSVFMEVDGEVGGNDQTFNMLMGRSLLKTTKDKEKFVITMKLLEDSSGKKMGKTEGNMVALNDDPDQVFGKIMSWSDGMILPGFELCTPLEIKEVKNISERLKNENPKEVKLDLAKKIVTTYFGEEQAEKSLESFQKTFSEKEGFSPTETIKVGAGSALGDVLTENKILSSKAEFKRLVEEGAIATKEGEKVDDFNYQVEKNNIFKVGKKKFIEIIIL